MRSSASSDARFRRAFDEHFDAVMRYCHRRLPTEDANDAAAQAFTVAWRKVEEMPPGEGTLPWLYRIASYEVSTVRRSSRRLVSLRTRLGGVRPEATPAPDAIVVRHSEHEAILDALWSLSPKDREVILLRTYEELPTAQVALVLGCSREAAKKRLSRALERLRKAAGVPAPAVMDESRAMPEGGDA